MIKIKLFDISTDEFDIDAFKADKGEAFIFRCDVEIGPEDAPNGENFQMVFCSPESFAHPKPLHNRRSLRCFTLFHDGFTKEVAENYLKEVCSAIRAETWEEAALKLTRYGRWEFEEYNSQPLPS